MPNLAQMGVDAFWAQLQNLENNAKRIAADLDTDKLELQHAYARAKAMSATITLTPPGGIPVVLPNPARVEALKALGERIHNNSVLRLRYRDLVANYNKAVNGAAAALKSIGLTAPQLGAVPLVVPIVAVTALGVALAIYPTVRLQTDAQRRATQALLNVLADPNSTAEQKAEATRALGKAADKPPPDIFGSLVPVLGLVALIVIGPQLLSAFGGRRSAA
jgi:hypothetical protein